MTFLPVHALPEKDEGRALWIIRTTLTSRSSIESAIRHALEGGFHTLFVQAVGRGDAYYPSSILPTSELLSGDGDFDPFGYFIDRAHKAGLEVHVWINLLYIWSSGNLPSAPNHVVRQHPDWVVVRYTGLSTDGARRNDVVGKGERDLFLSPALPEVREHLAGVVGEILDRYPVDGVHLDYIRYPSRDSGFESYARRAFSKLYRIDPIDIFVRSGAPTPAVGPVPHGQLESEWYRWRAQQVTELLAAIRKVQEEKSTEVTLSAAVIPDIIEAREIYGQDWTRWVNEGLIDFAVTMSYSPVKEIVTSQAREARQATRNGRLYIGIALYNQSLEKAAEKVEALREIGVDGFSFFSYNAMLENPDIFASIRKTLFTSRVPTSARE